MLCSVFFVLLVRGPRFCMAGEIWRTRTALRVRTHIMSHLLAAVKYYVWTFIFNYFFLINVTGDIIRFFCYTKITINFAFTVLQQKTKIIIYFCIIKLENVQ